MDLTEQRVTWAELFLDLIWVFAVTQIAHTLATAHSWYGVATTLLLLAPLWWGWVGVTLLGNIAGGRLDSAHGRLALFAFAGCGLGMAVSVPGAYQNQGLVFVGFFVLLRLLLWAGSYRISRKLHLDPFTVTLLVTCPLYVLGAFLPGGWRVLCWAVAAVVGPVFLRPRLKGHTFEVSHLPERFGLFVIIALGETVVAAGGQFTGSASDWLSLPLALALIVGLWWTYFHFGASAVKHALETDPAQSRIVRQVFSVAHFCYVIAIICVAVGLKKMIGHPFDVPHKEVELLLAPGVALYLLAFCYSRRQMFGSVLWPRLGGGLACVAIAGLAVVLPQFVTAILVVAVLAGTNAVEYWIVTTGRTLPVAAFLGTK